MNFGSNYFLLILAFEVIAVCLFLIALLWIRNRKLQKLIDKFKERLAQVHKDLHTAKAPPPAAVAAEKSYAEHLDEQLELTRVHHRTLGSHQDIALDLDPDSPIARRAAALRHALLIAEKEASAAGAQAVNWDFLATRYLQLLSFNETYAKPATDLEPELADTREELLIAQKRINNLEKFKNLYFELEERWKRCRSDASEQLNELQTLAEQTEHADDFNRLLRSHQAAYDDVGSLIINGVDAVIQPEEAARHYVELQRLRGVAADQHRIINELQDKLGRTNDATVKVQLVDSLQTELQKQARFLQESETCIKLMEDELHSANQEIAQLKGKLQQFSDLRMRIKDNEDQRDRQEQTIDALKSENRRIAMKLKIAQEAPPEDNDEARKLRKEINTLQSKYNDLEEKFLNLKLKE